MPTTDISANGLVINKLSKAQYDAIQNPSDTELYLVPDEIDNAPTSGSNNPVKSGGVYSALGNKQDNLVFNTAYNATSNKVATMADISNFVQKSSTSGLIKNDGTIDTNTYLTSHQDISNYVQKSSTSGLIKNDGTVDTNTYLTSHQDISNYVQKSSTSGLIKNDGTIDTTAYTTNTGTITGITMNGASKGTSGVVNLGTVITDVSDKANDSEVVHTTGTEQISGQKSFNNRVNFLGTGDANAIYLTTDTRIDVNGTSYTILGFASGTFLINHTNYNLKLRGKETRPTYNTDSNYLALLSDIPTVPTKVSDLTNDSGFITSYTESDPVFSASAAASITSADITAWNGKSTFSGSYNDLTDKPTIPTVPTNVSVFTNDAGYITDYTETDPTVPSWAKAASKPSYTASEVGAVPTTRTVNGKALSADITLSAADVNALPSSTVIPSAPGTLNTNNTTAQTVNSSESLSGTIKLHKVAKTGNAMDLNNMYSYHPDITTVPNVTSVGSASTWNFAMGTGSDEHTLIISGSNGTAPSLGTGIEVATGKLGGSQDGVNPAIVNIYTPTLLFPSGGSND